MAAADSFSSNAVGLDSPAGNAFAISPHDTNDLAAKPRGIFVGGAGDITVVIGGQTILFATAVAGTILPIRPDKVKATGTTATNLVAIY